MRLYAILLICLMPGCSAGGGPAFVRGPDSERVAAVLRSTRVEMDHEGVPFPNLIDFLRERCDVNFIIDGGVSWPGLRVLSVHCAGTAQELLDKACDAAGGSYYIDDGVVIVACCEKVRSRSSRP